jgi:hypothetical protein
MGVRTTQRAQGDWNSTKKQTLKAPCWRGRKMVHGSPPRKDEARRQMSLSSRAATHWSRAASISAVFIWLLILLLGVQHSLASAQGIPVLRVRRCGFYSACQPDRNVERGRVVEGSANCSALESRLRFLGPCLRVSWLLGRLRCQDTSLQWLLVEVGEREVFRCPFSEGIISSYTVPRWQPEFICYVNRCTRCGGYGAM